MQDNLKILLPSDAGGKYFASLIFPVFEKKWVAIFAIMIAGLFVALFKLNGVSVDRTLWAEDGRIFISQAREMGGASLWMPYAGYFHLYPRMVAWLSSFFDLELTPLFFLSAWFLAYCILIYVAASRALYYKFNIIEAVLLIMLMVAQPQTEEIFFTLTNAQWFIGGALAIYVLVPVVSKSSISENWMIFMASLTGPFSLILMPMLLVQLLIYHDWRKRKYVYMIVCVGAAIQLISIFSSNRLAEGGFDLNINHWVMAFFNFMSLGQVSIINKIVVMLFWIVFVYLFFSFEGEKPDRDIRFCNIIFLFFGSVFFFMAGLLASKENPHWLTPLGWGARYFFIPYVLIFFAAGFAALNRKKLQYFLYGLLVILSISSFSLFNPADLQFKAYAIFSKYIHNMVSNSRRS